MSEFQVVDTSDIRGHDGLNWPQTMDGQAWARAWMRITAANPSVPLDEDTMLGWFANAIMAGYDQAQRRAEQRQAEILSASEAVIGFASWLTTREEFTGAGLDTNGCGWVAELVGEFCRRHRLPELREEWEKWLWPENGVCATCGGSGGVELSGSDGVPHLEACPDCAGPA